MTSTPAAPAVRPPMRRVALSVLIGTTIEWYDFLIYGAAAALVFAPLFFPSDDPVAGTLLAFATFAVGFGARPIGAIVLGHFGDRLGRKKMLVLSLSLMGVATFLIGLLPTYETIGVWAPILLVVLRLVQGFGVGGEWGGAVLTAVEYATPEKRGLYGSLPQVGVPAGLLLSTLVFLGVSQLPEEQFLSWGWRVPFVISIVLVGIGLYIRLKLTETPAFERVKQSGAEVKIPIVVALKTYPVQILLATGSIISSGSFFYVLVTYTLAYGPESGAFTSSQMLTAILLSALVMVITLPYFGALSERAGRKRMVLIGLAMMGVWIFPTLLAVDSGNFPLLIGAYIVGAISLSVSYGPQATFIAELFDARVRFSASSLSFQLGVLLGGALAPIISAALVASTGTLLSVAVYVSLTALLSLACVLAVSKASTERGSADMGLGAAEWDRSATDEEGSEPSESGARR